MRAVLRNLFPIALACLALGFATGDIHADNYAHIGLIIDDTQAGTATGASGVGYVHIDTDLNTLDYNFSFMNLSSAETASHIHGPAPPGVGAGVKHGLALGTPKIGTWNYAESDEADILAGLMYVNIHSTNHPGGEIRGQIVPLTVPSSPNMGAMLATVPRSPRWRCSTGVS